MRPFLQRPSCLAFLALSACTPLHTAVENHTGHDVHLVIVVRDRPNIEGQLQVGQTLNLTEQIESLSRITYDYSATRCELRNGEVASAVQGRTYGRALIILRACER